MKEARKRMKAFGGRGMCGALVVFACGKESVVDSPSLGGMSTRGGKSESSTGEEGEEGELVVKGEEGRATSSWMTSNRSGQTSKS